MTGPDPPPPPPPLIRPLHVLALLPTTPAHTHTARYAVGSATPHMPVTPYFAYAPQQSLVKFEHKIPASSVPCCPSAPGRCGALASSHSRRRLRQTGVAGQARNPPDNGTLRTSRDGQPTIPSHISFHRIPASRLMTPDLGLSSLVHRTPPLDPARCALPRGAPFDGASKRSSEIF